MATGAKLPHLTIKLQVTDVELVNTDSFRTNVNLISRYYWQLGYDVCVNNLIHATKLIILLMLFQNWSSSYWIVEKFEIELPCL